MKIVKGTPPNYKEICKHFDVKDSPNIVFTYGDTLYIPSGRDPSGDLMSHEETHKRQQEAMGVEAWWERYFKDPEWRMEQELEAYRYQYRYARKRYTRNNRSALLDHISTDLSSKMYGNIVTKDEAKELIRKGK